jgi:hypothetical protein
MPDLFRVTVVASADDPVDDAAVDELVRQLAAAVSDEGPAQLAEDPVTVRSDRQGLDVVLLVEAGSADEAREIGERGALAAVAPDDPLRIELVRAEPAFAS